MQRALTLALALSLTLAPGAVLSQPKLRVVATSADLKSIAEAIGGARVEVESLASPEHDPHVIDLKPAQLARARSAVLLIRVGLDHEPWLAKLRLPPSVTIVDMSSRVRLIQTQTPRLRVERRAHVHAFGNTHYWLDPVNAIEIAAATRDALAKLSPNDQQLFDANYSAFGALLKSKVESWMSALAPYRGTKIVVVHDSWSYFAERFGLSIVAAAEPTPGVPPSPAELAALLQRMREGDVRIIVADPHSNPSLVRHIATQSGALVVTLAPSGDDYVRLIDANVTKLVGAMKGIPR
ncbi:MAG TPA: metal ABC transporter substrate-binding protein [Casimicrobiaceae bacterium]|nr:metal ABC transporter substrate-binding protein [Casimicrobiaceae bacterium]